MDGIFTILTAKKEKIFINYDLDGNKSGGVWSTIRKAQKAGTQIIYCPK